MTRRLLTLHKSLMAYILLAAACFKEIFFSSFNFDLKINIDKLLKFFGNFSF